MLRDLELDFATMSDKNLTVVRAANESGKTTVLHGLQWALYGDSALPGKSENFRLHPIDWDETDGKHVAITATVDFELTRYRRRSGETRKRYRLVRSATEDIDGKSRRSPSTMKLYELTEVGAEPIKEPEAFVNDELPPELRDVFFTDGDRALSFIEADATTSTKRERVQRAIRSLLGLGVIEDAIKHVRKSAAEVNKKAKAVGASSNLSEVAARLEMTIKQQDQLNVELKDATQGFEQFDERTRVVERQIEDALKHGDREQLALESESARKESERLDDLCKAATKDHSSLFRSEAIAASLLAPMLEDALAKLEELHDQGKIPSATIPVLHERLKAEVCICGESLSENDPRDHARRTHIMGLIDSNRREDEVRKILTDLYYRAMPFRDVKDSTKWSEVSETVLQKREQLEKLRNEAGRKQRTIEQKIDSLPDTDIKLLRQLKLDHSNQRDRFMKKVPELNTKLEELSHTRKRQEEERDRLLRDEKRGAHILAESDVTQDVIHVLQSAFNQITTEELKKVSDLMNEVFIDMIGADPDQGAAIQRAEISRDFDIIVFGRNDRKLDPDLDLNGASRRALTFAFILALTEVSEVHAPNVIDTPLGMTSGFVKRAILSTAIKRSAQLILFLTHDEIAGCEDIIDGAAGSVVTLTNPTHYPKMLVNNPNISELKVLRCDCDHNSSCQLCERHLNSEVKPDLQR